MAVFVHEFINTLHNCDYFVTGYQCVAVIGSIELR